MTAQKGDIVLPARTPAYVSREIGAAELCISPDTWDRMVAAGELPAPDKRLLGTLPRWKRTTIEAWLNGTADQDNINQGSPYAQAAEAVGRAKAQEKRRG